MALYEDRQWWPKWFRPPVGFETMYGFKHAWFINVTEYNLADLTFKGADITDIMVNGGHVVPDQMRLIYSFNKEYASIVAPGVESGLLIVLTHYDPETDLWHFIQAVSQSFEANGVLSVTGPPEVVDNTDPQRPVLLHDSTKLDVSQYNTDKSVLETRLQTDEDNIQSNSDNISILKTETITNVLVNGALGTIDPASRISSVQLDIPTTGDMTAALALKVDKNVAGPGNRIVQAQSETFDTTARTLTFNRTLLSLADGSTQPETDVLPLASLLGITNLESIDKELIYLIDDASISAYNTSVTVQLSALYRYNADGSVFKPTTTANIQTLMSVVPYYSAPGVQSGIRIASIGYVNSYTTTSIVATFTNLRRYVVYNPNNGYRPQVLAYDEASQGLYYTVQAVPAPTSQATIIPLTNQLYYQPVKDLSIMPPNTIFANFEDTENPGIPNDVDTTRIELMKGQTREYAGYNDYVEFKGNVIPPQINSDSDWNQYITLWVTDGIIFTDLNSLVAYLGNFVNPGRYKISNLGVIQTLYQSGGITITPKFGLDQISILLSDGFVRTVPTAIEANIAIFATGGEIADSGTQVSDLATATQGALADSAIQSVSASEGSNNGAFDLTVDGVTASIPIHGLDSAAYQPATAFATAAQGNLADSSLQSVTLETGTDNGTLKLTTATATGNTIQDNVAVKGLGTAAYTNSTAYATAAQGVKADTALQPSDVVDGFNSTDTNVPGSANNDRLLNQRLTTLESASSRIIGGFADYASRYTNTNQFPPEIQPVAINDAIYIASDENSGGAPALYNVTAIAGDGTITYTFNRVLPDSSRDFLMNPIETEELANGAVTDAKIRNRTILAGSIAADTLTRVEMSTDVKNALSQADTSIQPPIVTVGLGNVVTGVSIDANKNINQELGYAARSLTQAGAGNTLISLTLTDGVLTATRGTRAQSFAKSGMGNVISDVTMDSSGAAVLVTDTMLKSAVTIGSGNVVTAITVINGVLQITLGNALTAFPHASTTQPGIVQLNDTNTSTATDQAATANRVRVLDERITSVNNGAVHLEGTETITGQKTFALHVNVPAKTTLPTTPSQTQYATEAQAFTRIAKPQTATQNNLAAFDNNRNVMDTGINYQAVQAKLAEPPSKAMLPAQITTHQINPGDWIAHQDHVMVEIAPPPAVQMDSPAPETLFSREDIKALQNNGSPAIDGFWDAALNVLRLETDTALSFVITPQVTWRSDYE